MKKYKYEAIIVAMLATLVISCATAFKASDVQYKGAIGRSCHVDSSRVEQGN